MKDFLNSYKKNKIAGNISIVIISLVLAIGVNLFLIDDSNFGNNLKGSIIESNINKNNADIFLEKSKNNLVIKNSKKMNNVSNLSFSINYNPEDIELLLENDSQTTIIENTKGFKTIILNLESKTFEKNNILSKIEVKNINNKSSNINIVNANFTDTEKNKFDLTTSGVTF